MCTPVMRLQKSSNIKESEKVAAKKINKEKRKLERKKEKKKGSLIRTRPFDNIVLQVRFLFLHCTNGFKSVSYQMHSYPSPNSTKVTWSKARVRGGVGAQMILPLIHANILVSCATLPLWKWLNDIPQPQFFLIFEYMVYMKKSMKLQLIWCKYH